MGVGEGVGEDTVGVGVGEDTVGAGEETVGEGVGEDNVIVGSGVAVGVVILSATIAATSLPIISDTALTVDCVNCSTGSGRDVKAFF